MQPVTRDAPLEAELERAISEHEVRVALLHGTRGIGRTTVLRSFAERMRSRITAVSLVEAEPIGDFPGACVDVWLRSRLGLAPEVTGPDVEAAVAAALPDADPLAREFFCTMLGYSAPGFRTASLDSRARWEGATAELERWLAARAREPWMLLIDDVQAADPESMSVVEVVAAGALELPALVVLSVRDDALAAVEAKLKPLRNLGRLSVLALGPPPAAELLHELPAAAVESARGNPLLAKLVAATGAELRVPTLDALLTEVLRRAAPLEQQVLGVLAVAGGRLPLAVLCDVLGEKAAIDVVDALCRAVLVSRAGTRRFPGDYEVAIRFPKLLAEAEKTAGPERARQWLGLLGVWAESVVREGGHAWSSRLPLIAPLLAASAERAGDAVRASLAWEVRGRGEGGLPALRRAEATASGTRRLVLVRRIADDELFRGEVQKAITTAGQAARIVAAPATLVPEGWEAALFPPDGDPLDRWDRLTADEALVAAELVKAEGFSQLAQNVETRSAFEGVEAKLKRLAGGESASLWMRWARTWAWFNAEILASGSAARRVCELVRTRLGPEGLASSFYGPAFLRAEQVASSRGGDAGRARALADELIAVAKERGDAREECVAWNARALLHLRDGNLSAARSGFERSLDLARAIGYRRREAIALHNLGLTLCQLGEDGASLACQERYLALSEQIGNFVARAYGPAAMASVLVPSLDVPRVEALISRARRAAEENSWPALVSWTRLLSAELKISRYLERKDSLLLSLARNDLLACLDTLEETQAAWAEELDPAQAYVLLALAWRLSANDVQAKAVLVRGARCAKDSPVSAKWLETARAALTGARPDAQLAWLEEHGYQRIVHFWSRALPALGLS